MSVQLNNKCHKGRKPQIKVFIASAQHMLAPSTVRNTAGGFVAQVSAQTRTSG